LRQPLIGMVKTRTHSNDHKVVRYIVLPIRELMYDDCDGVVSRFSATSLHASYRERPTEGENLAAIPRHLPS
jgi:hypothetical protein